MPVGGYMRWRAAVLCALSLVVMTACPETYRRGGRADRAAHKDATEFLQQQCSQVDYDEFCKGQEESQECLDQCG